MDALPIPRHTLEVAALTQRTQALLRAGVPLSLLLDLADEDGPRSRARYADEGGDISWLKPR